jgi:hypothetical protein
MIVKNKLFRVFGNLNLTREAPGTAGPDASGSQFVCLTAAAGEGLAENRMRQHLQAGVRELLHSLILENHNY